MLKGITLKVGATFLFALMSALIKTAATRFPVAEVVFFRSIFALGTLALWLIAIGELKNAWRTERPLGHIGRSIAGSAGMIANFVALSLLPLADATALTFATPLMVVPLAALTLGEEVRFYRGAAVAIGFVGVVIMLSDHLGEGLKTALETDGAGLGALVGLAGSVTSAAAMIQTRRLTHSEPTGAIVFYFSTLTGAIGALALIGAALWPADAVGGAFVAGQRFVTPSGAEFAMLVVIGLLGGGGQILMTHSYRFADAAIIAAFDYVTMIWATALGFIVFAEKPSARVVLGALVVIAAGVLMLWREREARKIRAVPAAALAENRGA